ncbi:MAG: hypothetical protein WDW36_010005 [Sanguina aurantia]
MASPTVGERIASTMAYLKDYVSSIKAGRSHIYSPVERICRAATRNEPWGPSGTMLNELAELSHDPEAVQVIFAVLEYRMKLPPARWQNVYKALLVLHFLITRGSETAVALSCLLALQLTALAHFQHVNAAGRDCGIDVQRRSQLLRELIADEAGLGAERARCMSCKARLAGSGPQADSPPGHAHNRAKTMPGSSPSGPDKIERHDSNQPSIATYTSAATPMCAWFPRSHVAERSNAKAKVTPAEAKANLEDLQRLLSLPHNRTCADCRSTSAAARPSWASINTGAFICMRCAGIHRGLGVHVSQVRSCSLDTWLRAQVDFMAATGNAAANAHWEATLDPAADLRPPRDSPALERFIRLKYCERAWVHPSSTWPPACQTLNAAAETSAALVGESGSSGDAAAGGTPPAAAAAAGGGGAVSGPTIRMTADASAGFPRAHASKPPAASPTVTPTGFPRASVPDQPMRLWPSHSPPEVAVQQQQQQQVSGSVSDGIAGPVTMDLLHLDSDDACEVVGPGSSGAEPICGFSLPAHVRHQNGQRDPFQAQHHSQAPQLLQQQLFLASPGDHRAPVNGCHPWVPDGGNSSHSRDPFHASSGPQGPSYPQSTHSHHSSSPHSQAATSLTVPAATAGSSTYEWQDFGSPSAPAQESAKPFAPSSHSAAAVHSAPPGPVAVVVLLATASSTSPASPVVPSRQAIAHPADGMHMAHSAAPHSTANAGYASHGFALRPPPVSSARQQQHPVNSDWGMKQQQHHHQQYHQQQNQHQQHHQQNQQQHQQQNQHQQNQQQPNSGIQGHRPDPLELDSLVQQQLMGLDALGGGKWAPAREKTRFQAR